MNKTELQNIISGFDATSATAQSIGGTPANRYVTAFHGTPVLGAPNSDVQAATTGPKQGLRFDIN